MRVAVFQSYKPGPKPNWLQRCIDSVRKWADAHAYAYIYLEDDLFDVLPAGIRAKHAKNIWPATDLARVMYADRLLQSGRCDRAIWIDADVFVLNASEFRINLDHELTLCREVWISTDFEYKYFTLRKVNNCIMAIGRGSGYLRDYIAYARDAVGQPGVSASPLSIGTDVFTNAEMAGTLEAEVIESVLMISPYVMQEIENDGRSTCAEIQKLILKQPISALHFAESFSSEHRPDVRIAKEAFTRLAERIIERPAAFFGPPRS